MTAEVTQLVPRPPGLGRGIDDEQLIQAVRHHLSGGRMNELAPMLGVETSQARRILLTPQWRQLQMHVAREFMETLGGRVQRLESKVMEVVESMIEDGVTRYNMEGEPYQAKLSPKEVISLWGCIQASQKIVADRLDGSRKPELFDPNKLKAELERFAKAREINIGAEVSRETD